jgi:hypothetical protein
MTALICFRILAQAGALSLVACYYYFLTGFRFVGREQASEHGPRPPTTIAAAGGNRQCFNSKSGCVIALPVGYHYRRLTALRKQAAALISGFSVD